MTSIRRSSVRELWVFKSRSRTLVQTDAPASRQMQAIARSIATPLDRRAPERGHDARWSPNGSSERWHLHLAGMCGKGSRSRRNNKTRKWADSNTRSGDVGSNVNAVAAKGPLCESSRACDAGSKADRTAVL